MRTLIVFLGLCVCAPVAVWCQAGGDIEGRVREAWGRRVGIEGAHVTLDASTVVAVTDLKGRFRFRGVPVGSHVLGVVASGYASARADTVPVVRDITTRQDFLLVTDTARASQRPPIAIIDPLNLDDRQRFGREELRDLPVSTVGEAIQLLNGVAGTSFYGGRPGSQVALVADVPLRNLYDASTAGLGLELPLDLVQDLTLSGGGVTLAGERALSGVYALDSRQGGDRWTGAARYETDRLFTGSTDQGYDRVRLEASGPIANGVRIVGAVDGIGRLQQQPHGAPTGDPLAPLPWQLPHNSGTQVNGAILLTAPVGAAGRAQVLAAHSIEQYELFAPAYKYAPGPEPGRSIKTTLLTASARRVSSPTMSQFISLAYVTRDFEQGVLASSPPSGLGALALSGYTFSGDGIARSLDTTVAKGSVPGYAEAFLATQTPWGVPEFVQGNDPRGDLFWNRTNELSANLGLDGGGNGATSFGAEAGVTIPQVSAFHRTLAYMAVGDSVPPATASKLSAVGFHLTGRLQTRLGGGIVTALARCDGFDPGSALGGGLRIGVSPAVSLLVPLASSTLTIEAAQVAQFPDLQFLANLAFNDSLENGHYRLGASDLGYEVTRQVSVGLRSRFNGGQASGRVFGMAESNLVATSSTSASADSGRFTNAGSGRVFGVDIRVEKSIGAHADFLVGYTFLSTSYDAATAYRTVGANAPLDQDRPHHVVAILRGNLPVGIRGGAVWQYASGFPYTHLGSATVNGERAPSQMTLDMLLRRELHLAGRAASLYLEARNLLNRANLLGVRRDNGQPGISAASTDSLAAAGYQANPTPIPYESPYYKASEDLNQNGQIDGLSELLPLYHAAAADFGAPLTAFAAPREVRLGVELLF